MIADIPAEKNVVLFARFRLSLKCLYKYSVAGFSLKAPNRQESKWGFKISFLPETCDWWRFGPRHRCLCWVGRFHPYTLALLLLLTGFVWHNFDVSKLVVFYLSLSSSRSNLCVFSDQIYWETWEIDLKAPNSFEKNKIISLPCVAKPVAVFAVLIYLTFVTAFTSVIRSSWFEQAAGGEAPTSLEACL